MASIRKRPRRDGTIAYAVLYTIDGRQSSLPFEDPKAAEAFRAAVNAHGPTRALEMHGIDSRPRRRDSNAGMTVAEWVTHHIDHLTGVDPRTVEDYRSYLRTDIGPGVGAIPLTQLSRDDVRRWVQALERSGASAKTIANKHALLSTALSSAVTAGRIGANPAAGTRLPRGERQEMVFLTHEDFDTLLAEIPDHWQPLVLFLVASGCRWGEATALKPGDVDRKRNTVRISKAWRRGGGGYRIGLPKTRRSVRTINVPATVLDKLNYTGEWLFTNPGRGNRAVGGPVRAPNFRANVWWPAIKRAWPEVDDQGNPIANPLRPRIHDLRHTAASWFIQDGKPLPAIQQHLGHESIKTTVDVYGHLDRRSGEDLADSMGKWLT